MSVRPKSLSQRQQEVSSAAMHGEMLLEFQKKGSSSSLFLDPDFGEFRCSYYHFIQGKTMHPNRKPPRKANNCISEDDARRRIENLDYSISLVKYGGSVTSKSVFMDGDYGEFEGIFRDVARGKLHHPDRKKSRLSKNSKKLWSDPEYVKKVQEGAKNVDYSSALARRKYTMKLNHGYEYALQNPEILQKARNTCRERHGDECYARTEAYKEFIKDYFVKIGKTKTYDGLSMKEHAASLDKAYTTFQSQVKKYGFEIALNIVSRGESGLEMLMGSILGGIKCKIDKQREIGGKFADFVVNDRVVIETDGLYWHSDHILPSNDYHIKKRIVYETNGFRPLFFREDELRMHPSIVQSIIVNAINMSEKIGARQCEIDQLGRFDGCEFFRNNHLMGQGKGQINALIKDNKVMAAIQIKKTKRGHEISRFCTRNNWCVQGALSRLINHSIRQMDIKLLDTFIDRRYGKGDYLSNLGFQLTSSNLSFRWSNGYYTFHRMRHPGNSGYEKGLYKIWDCGQDRYTMKVV